MKNNSIPLLISLILLLTACSTQNPPNNLNYFENGEKVASEAAVQNVATTIQKNDHLVIFVSAKNMEVVRPFNQNYYNTQTPGMSSNANSEKLYVVDSEGNIDFSVVGKVSAEGKTLEQLKNDLTTRVTEFVKEPTVVIRLANFKVTVLGEVNRPGQYTVPEGQTTILNALGLAGDLTIYGQRTNVLLVRNMDGELTKQRINLLDSNFINSPYFQLKQGDVIYVSANETKQKISRQDPNTNLYLAIAGTVIGLAGIFITIFKN